MDIAYYLHCASRPQSSGKVERANQILKLTKKKTIQETSLGWKEALPIDLLCTCIAPKKQVGLSPFETVCGRPFVDANGSDPLVYTMAIGHFQQDVHLQGINQDSKDSKKPPLYVPGTQVLIKVWKGQSPKAQFQSTWKYPYTVILSTPTAIKVL